MIPKGYEWIIDAVHRVGTELLSDDWTGEERDIILRRMSPPPKAVYGPNRAYDSFLKRIESGAGFKRWEHARDSLNQALIDGIYQAFVQTEFGLLTLETSFWSGSEAVEFINAGRGKVRENNGDREGKILIKPASAEATSDRKNLGGRRPNLSWETVWAALVIKCFKGGFPWEKAESAEGWNTKEDVFRFMQAECSRLGFKQSDNTVRKRVKMLYEAKDLSERKNPLK